MSPPSPQLDGVSELRVLELMLDPFVDICGY